MQYHPLTATPALFEQVNNNIHCCKRKSHHPVHGFQASYDWRRTVRAVVQLCEQDAIAETDCQCAVSRMSHATGNNYIDYVPPCQHQRVLNAGGFHRDCITISADSPLVCDND